MGGLLGLEQRRIAWRMGQSAVQDFYAVVFTEDYRVAV